MLMVPYLVWLSFAGVLNWRIDQLNPDAERLVPGAQTPKCCETTFGNLICRPTTSCSTISPR